MKKITDLHNIIELYEDYKLKINNKIGITVLNKFLDDYECTTQIDFNKFLIYINQLYSFDDNDNEKFVKIYDEIMRTTEDISQIKTIVRIKKYRLKMNKTIIPCSNSDDFVDNHKKIYRCCPHCNKKNYTMNNTIYVICGYSNKGFDWIGCQKDWCFSCGKKLCKCWDIDELFNICNRFHDGKCCKKYAHDANYDYKKEYCQCCNMYVNRNIKF
jgi:hypothetical protein